MHKTLQYKSFGEVKFKYKFKEKKNCVKIIHLKFFAHVILQWLMVYTKSLWHLASIVYI